MDPREMQLPASVDKDEISVDGSWSPPPSMESGEEEVLKNGCIKEEVFLRNGLVNIEEGSAEFEALKKNFLKGMNFMGHVTTIVAVHKNNISFDLGRQARSVSFEIFSRAVANKRGGNPNRRHAWYGGSLEELTEIVSTGFSICRITTEEEEDDESHGVGICLYPGKFSIDGAVSTVADEDGVRHVLLCRVILGSVEVVLAGSKQSQPSSKKYDSGVDNILAPRKYIIWGAFVNSHIHPDYIISFKYDYKVPRLPQALKSGPIILPNLMPTLLEHLEPSKMALLVKTDNHYRERRIRKQEWIKKVRKIVGDRLLISVLRSFRPNLMFR